MSPAVVNILAFITKMETAVRFLIYDYFHNIDQIYTETLESIFIIVFYIFSCQINDTQKGFIIIIIM